MVEKIIKAISKTLNQVFGDDFEIYFSKDVQQGLKEPCFFIALVGSSRIRRIGVRYQMLNSFVVQYFPKLQRGNIEMIGVAEQLLDALEYVQLSEDDTVFGTATVTVTEKPIEPIELNNGLRDISIPLAEVVEGECTAFVNGGAARGTFEFVIPEEPVITVSPATMDLQVGETGTLTATVTTETYNQNVTWTTSDENIATVSETGVVTAVGEGAATITATSVDGDLVQGTAMNYSIQDGVLQFFVDFNMFLKKEVALDEMETLMVDANTTQEG